MTVWVDRISRRFRPSWFTLAPIVLVAFLLLFFPPDGNERTQWMQFIGRFHPLTVHFPIALFLLVPVLELAGRNARFSHLRLSSTFVLGLATIAATAATLLGWCLARSGGYSGPLVAQHMWAGVSLAAVCWLCWRLRAQSEMSSGIIYAIALVCGVIVVGFTGYRGGQLSQGEDHLTRYMPGLVRHLLGLTGESPASPDVGVNSFYSLRVQPIFAERCTRCHGPDKHKSDLRLDSYSSLMKGGKHGRVIQAENLQASDLFRRITLPPENDDFMPKEAKRPLSADQVKTIELWITAGASGTLPVDGIKEPPASSAPPAATEVKFEEIDPAAVTKLRANIAPKVAQLQKQFPNVLDYESRGSADLVLNASVLAQKFGDADLSAFASIAEQVAIADLSRTAITDHSAPVLAAMKQLRVLRLANTKITDATVRELGGLNELESLNVFGTPVTSAALPACAKLPRLGRVYVGQTAIRSGSAVPESLNGKLVF